MAEAIKSKVCTLEFNKRFNVLPNKIGHFLNTEINHVCSLNQLHFSKKLEYKLHFYNSIHHTIG